MNFLVKYALKIRGSLNHLGDYGYVQTRPMGQAIPKIIHQTYFSKTLPTEIQENIDKLKALNPDWEFRFYDDDDIEQYIRRHYPSLITTYQKISPSYGVAKADLFRYLVIYHDGGIYLDIKSSADIPFNELILPDDRYLLSHWLNGPGQVHEAIGFHRCIPHTHGEFQQWHVIATSGHPFLKAVIENVCNNIHHYNPVLHDTGGWGVVNLTGPIAYTLAISKYLHHHPHRIVRSNQALGLVYSLYEVKNLGHNHHSHSKTHYTRQTDSIIKLTGYKKLMFSALNPLIQLIKKQLINLRKKSLSQSA